MSDVKRRDEEGRRDSREEDSKESAVGLDCEGRTWEEHQ